MTDEEFNRSVAEFERIDKMTPDEAYRYSVEKHGQEPGISAAEDAAARIPEASMDAVRSQVQPAAPVQPVAPVQPKTAIGTDGKSHVLYQTADKGQITVGSPEYEQLDSTKMMRRMEQGHGADANPDYERWRNQALYNAQTLKRRKQMQGARNHLLADTLREAWVDLNGGLGDVKTTNDGRRYRVVMYRNDGEDNPVSRLNRMNENMGRRGGMTSLAAIIEVGEDGKPKVDAKGRAAQPIFKYGFDKDGGKKATAFRSLSPAEIMNQWADTYAAKTGHSQLEARRAAVNAFGGDSNLAGRNPAGWNIAPTAQELEDEKRRQFDEKTALERQGLDAKTAAANADREESARQFDETMKLKTRQMDDQAQSRAFEQKAAIVKMAMDFQRANNGAAISRDDLYKEILKNKDLSAAMFLSPAVDDNGNPVTDEMGNPKMQFDAANAAKNLDLFWKAVGGSQPKAAANNPYADMIAQGMKSLGDSVGVLQIGKPAAQAPAQAGASAQGAQQPRNGASPRIADNGNLVMQDGTVVEPGGTYTNKNGKTMRWKGGDINAWEPVDGSAKDNQTSVGSKHALSQPLSQVNGEAPLQQQTVKPNPNADNGKRWNNYINATLREAFPSDNITPDAVASGVYDGPLMQIAKESNDPAFAKYVDDFIKRNAESRQKAAEEKAAQAKANYEKELKMKRIRKAKPKSSSPITDSFMAVPMP